MAWQSLRSPGRFCIVSSCDNWTSVEDMLWDSGVYRYRGRLISPGQSFQILRAGSRDAAIYPSINNATPCVAHVLKGPDRNGHGFNWTVPAKPGERGAVEVILSCPKGTLLSLTWLINGESVTQTRHELDVVPASDRDGQQRLFQKNFGQWQLQGEIGRGKQRGAVFAAEGRGCRAAVKFPVSVREIQHLAALRGVAGVPELLDCGNGPGSGPFHATPVLGQSLEEILRRCEDTGLGSQMCWSAAQALGTELLTTLQAIHARGVIHCDISPLNVLVGPKCRPFLIDFGLSRALGAAHFAQGEGTVEYSSVRAGLLEQQRMGADDLESLGWLLWRCVVGRLPWHGIPREVDWSDRGARQGVYERISTMKERILEKGFCDLGAPWDFCPEQLKAYFLRIRAETRRGDPEVAPSAYSYLRSLLDGGLTAEERWSDVVTGKPRTFYEAEHKKLVWRPPVAAGLTDAEVLAAGGRARVVGTGRSKAHDGGLWAELDPVWLPGLPKVLCEQGGWVLVADWAGQLLQRVTPNGECLPREGASNSAAAEPDQQACEVEKLDEWEQEEERAKELYGAAVTAAQHYTRQGSRDRFVVRLGCVRE